jgi:hypothetical protein
MARIKYMGTSDIRRIEKGADFGGQLSKEAALSVDLQWDWDNNHIIDTDDEKFSGVSEEFWDLLLEDDAFRDVSDLKRIPTNGAQQMWKGMKKTDEAETAAVHASGKAETDEESSQGGGVSEASGTTTPPAPATGATKKAAGRLS